MTKRNSITAIVIAAGFAFVLGYGLSEATDGAKEVLPEVTVPVGEKVSPQEPKIVLDPDNEYEEPDVEEATEPVEEGIAVHEDLRDETPPGVDLEDVDKINEDASGLTDPLPVGGAQNYSCPRNLVRNFSDRASGTRVGLFVLHYTVSRPGSLNVIRGLFDRPSFGASSHLGLEPTGRCEQWVAWNNKAWTQGAYNSVSESVEIICCNVRMSRAWWVAQPIIKNEILAAIAVDRLRARGIPARLVDPVGCDVQRAGWTDHMSLECGNSHIDVQPYFPYDILQAQIVRRYNAGEDTPLPGPRPKPAWWWRWCNWHLGGREGDRSDNGPVLIPTWGWQACDQWNEEH